MHGIDFSYYPHFRSMHYVCGMSGNDFRVLTGAENELVNLISAGLTSRAETARAEGMQNYMKGKFDFMGIASPERRKVLNPFWPLPEGADIEQIAPCLYEQPYRELHYAALDLLERDVKSAPESRIGLYGHLLVQHQWWDSIDRIASKLIGPHFARFPHLIPKYHEEWMSSNDIWLQRTCLLFQLHYKSALDEGLLKRTIEVLRGSDEFFIQKGIGWILRQYARTNPDWVKNFVDRTSLKPLSRREALKHFG